jgi:small subunit ribosomal protein S20
LSFVVRHVSDHRSETSDPRSQHQDWIEMANTPSAKKAARKIARKTAANKVPRTRMRSFVRQVEEAIAAGDKNAARAALRAAQPQIMKAAAKGVIHRHTASRKVSRLSHRVEALA